MNALIIMSRVPTPYKTNTRLIGLLSPTEAATIHLHFLMDIHKTLRTLPDSTRQFLYYGKEGSAETILDLFTPQTSHFLQEGTTLGEIQSFAFSRLFSEGYDKVVLMGTDIPHISAEIILEAFESLSHKDIVFGPTLDGGYYLVGMRTPHLEIFDNSIAWGEDKTFVQTIEKIARVPYTLLPTLQDIDNPQDLVDIYLNDTTKNLEMTHNSKTPQDLLTVRNSETPVIRTDSLKKSHTYKYIMQNLKEKLLHAAPDTEPDTTLNTPHSPQTTYPQRQHDE